MEEKRIGRRGEKANSEKTSLGSSHKPARRREEGGGGGDRAINAFLEQRVMDKGDPSSVPTTLLFLADRFRNALCDAREESSGGVTNPAKLCTRHSLNNSVLQSSRNRGKGI